MYNWESLFLFIFGGFHVYGMPQPHAGPAPLHCYIWRHLCTIPDAPSRRFNKTALYRLISCTKPFTPSTNNTICLNHVFIIPQSIIYHLSSIIHDSAHQPSTIFPCYFNQPSAKVRHTNNHSILLPEYQRNHLPPPALHLRTTPIHANIQRSRRS